MPDQTPPLTESDHTPGWPCGGQIKCPACCAGTAPDHMGTLDDDERCHRCGGENIRWSAPSPLWNRVMRGNDINGEPRYRDLVCIRCFIVLAFEEGIDGTWRVSVDPEPEGLIYETPSGRIWNRERGLWVDPPPTPRDVYVVHTPRGFTEAFDRQAIDLMERLGLIRHERDDHVLQDGSGRGIGPLHRFYREVDHG